MHKGNIAVEAKGLTKQYGYIYGVKDASFQVYEGEVFGLFGPNGAGKTTLLRLMAMLTRPSEGELRIGELDAVKNSEELKREIGILTHHSLLYDDLTGRENLEFYLKMQGFTEKGELSKRINEVARLFGIEDRLDDPVRTLSSGLRRRFDLARSIIHEPKLLFLDEPLSGLDVESVNVLKNFLLQHKGEWTVILSTHNFEVAKEICDRIAFMKDGKLVEIVEAADYSHVKVEKYFA